MTTRITTVRGKVYVFDAAHKARTFLILYLTASALMMMAVIALLCFVPGAIGLVSLTVLLQGLLLRAKGNDCSFAEAFGIVLLSTASAMAITEPDPLMRALYTSPTWGQLGFCLLNTMYEDATAEPNADVAKGEESVVDRLNELLTLDAKDVDDKEL